jgi:hypothetical protein
VPWALAAVLGVVLVIVLLIDLLADNNQFDLGSVTAPAEYLYLDTERVGSYLAQAENGLTEEEKRTRKEITSLSGEAGLEGVKLGGSVQRERAAEQTVKPTDNSRFYRLLTRLGDEGVEVNGQPALVELDFSKSRAEITKSMEKVQQGGFVEIRNARIARPPYVVLYYSLRQAVSDRSALTLGILKPRDVDDARKLVTRVGDNPRLPLFARAVAESPEDNLEEIKNADNRAESERPPTVFLTAQFANFAPASSLFRTRLSVLGKVIHKPVKAPALPRKKLNFRQRYVDEESISTFAPALRSASARVQRALGVRRGKIERTLTRRLSVVFPHLVVLPVAIYS